MDLFINTAREMLGLQLTREQIAAFAYYESELSLWNEQINLTAIRDPQGIQIKHFLDSLTCVLALDMAKLPRTVIDVGTGAGFPGIPLKMIHPQMKLTLVESVHKKADFCSHIAEGLKLRQVDVISERAEEIGQDPQHREAYDLVLARAVAHMPTLVEFLLPLARVGGLVIMQKGETAHAEAQRSEKAIALLGGRLKKIIPIVLPGVVDERYLVLVEKIAQTPSIYPRHTGTPGKQPL